LNIKCGEVHALIGENGAGKSTLLNILTGNLNSDEGEIILKRERLHLKNPLAAREHGIVRVHQELQLIKEMTVGQNIFLGREPKTPFKTIDYKKIYNYSEEILRKLDVDFSSRDVVGDLSTAQMQMVEISKALLQDFVVLALDEPTSSLTQNEIKRLIAAVKQLRNEGKAIIYISHRMEEIFDIADRATVLRDGNLMGVVDIGKVSRQELIRMMVGRDITEQTFNETAFVTDEVILRVNNLSGKKFRNLNFELKKGEVIGFAGLIGAGRTEIARALFGIDHCSGEIVVRGSLAHIAKPSDAKRYGIMLIPEDRKFQGMVGLLQNKSNISLSNLNKYKKFGVMNHSAIKQDAKQFIDTLKIIPADEEMITSKLSGGNQQKVVIARMLNVEPDILILDEPTRGIDINVKFEIYKLIRNFAKQGKAIIMISSELSEIISLSDRVIVMYEGTSMAELNRSELTEENIMYYAMGGSGYGKG
jgi:ribose transport system ATP-binding protein